MTYKAKLIVLEGIDGTGKTTTANKLKEHYEQQGKKVKLYHEPYKFASFDVKQIIKDLEANKNQVSDFAILNLMIANRDISVNNILIPALNEYDIVIADRYYYSTYAYQANIIQEPLIEYDTDIDFYWDKCILNYPLPDKILYFRINDLDNYNNNKLDYFELKGTETFKDIQSEYDYLFNYYRLGKDHDFKHVKLIEVNQNKQQYFNFQEVLEALEGI